MRPSVSEQLEGISRVLAEVIAPQVADPYSASILKALMVSLDSLAVGWKEVPEFLHWDADGTADILNASLPHLDQGTADDLASALAEAPINKLDVTALEAHHRRMRAVLEQAVPVIVEQPDLRIQLVAHLRSRVGRFPVTTISVARPAQTEGSHAHTA